MPIYFYKALSPTGELIQDSAQSDSKESLVNELAKKGIHVESVRRGSETRYWFQRKPKPDDVALLNQEFIALLKAGLPIPEILEIVTDDSGSSALGDALRKIRKSVNSGSQLSKAFGEHSQIFDAMHIAALKTGEKSGDLISSLESYQHWLRRRIELGKKISRALVYPLFLAGTLTVIILLLLMFVIPRFVSMYAELGSELPFATRILINVFNSFLIWGPILAAGLLFLFIGYRWLMSRVNGRVVRDRFIAAIPFIGSLTRLSTLVQIGGMLSALLSAGTPIVTALNVTANAVRNRAHGESLKKVAFSVSEGAGLADSLWQSGLLTPSARKLIEVGEASGRLDQMLTQLASYYDEVLDHRLTRLTSLVEPTVMLLMGAIIGVVIVVMYLPIFHMAGAIR